MGKTDLPFELRVVVNMESSPPEVLGEYVPTMFDEDSVGYLEGGTLKQAPRDCVQIASCIVMIPGVASHG